MFHKKTMIPFIGICVVVGGLLIFVSSQSRTHQILEIAIASWEPQSSSEETIKGIKDGLHQDGYEDGQDVHYEILNMNSDLSHSRQMLTKIKSLYPAVFVALTASLAQQAKAEIKDLPLVFTGVNDPVSAGLLDEEYRAKANLTGVSGRVDLDAFLDFALKFLPQAQRIGILFATAEANDRAIIKMMESAAAHHSMLVLAVPVDDIREIPNRMQKFQASVDFIYLGSSDAMKPFLAAIAEEAARMKIPVFSADAYQVRTHEIFAAFTVSHYQVGLNTAKVIAKILEGAKPEDIAPVFPSFEDHAGFVSRKKAVELGINIPTDLKRINLIE